MREILFRGKRIDNGEWVEGSLQYSKARNEALIWHEDEKDKYGYANTVIANVDPSTVGQYTGLTDKNDNKIFEGDIVLNQNGIPYVCAFIEEYARFAFKRKGVVFGWFNPSYGEIIGNIHDNPELLKGE